MDRSHSDLPSQPRVSSSTPGESRWWRARCRKTHCHRSSGNTLFCGEAPLGRNAAVIVTGSPGGISPISGAFPPFAHSACAILPSQLCWSLASVNPSSHTHAKEPSVFSHTPWGWQRSGSLAHSSMSGEALGVFVLGRKASLHLRLPPTQTFMERLTQVKIT